MWVEYDDGAHLSHSHKKPGDFRPLARDDTTNELSQVTLSPYVEDEADPATGRNKGVEALALAAAVAVGFAIARLRRASRVGGSTVPFRQRSRPSRQRGTRLLDRRRQTPDLTRPSCLLRTELHLKAPPMTRVRCSTLPGPV
jgi:hypothetical protein